MGYVGNQQAEGFVQRPTKQDLTGATGTSLTLSHAVSKEEDIDLYINNVKQEPTTAYTVADTAVTLTGSVVATDDIYVVYNSLALQTVTPPDGSVTSAKLVYPLTTFSSTGIDDNATSTAMTLDSSGNVGIGTSSPNAKLEISHVADNRGGIKVTTSNNTGLSEQGGFLALGGNNTGVFVGTNGASYTTGGIGTANEATIYSVGNVGLAFGTNTTERMRIDSSGNLLVGTTASSITSATSGTIINSIGYTDSKRNSTAASSHLQFYNPNGLCGYIYTSGTSTAYLTSSDYRLKENVTDITGATERLKQLNPVRFNFIADADTTVDGFLAHEVQDVVPEAISGTKDAVDDDGNPVYQGIDQSKLVPLLVATIQELEARIAALESA